VADTDTKHMVT